MPEYSRLMGDPLIGCLTGNTQIHDTRLPTHHYCSPNINSFLIEGWELGLERGGRVFRSMFFSSPISLLPSSLAPFPSCLIFFFYYFPPCSCFLPLPSHLSLSSLHLFPYFCLLSLLLHLLLLEFTLLASWIPRC